MGSRKTIDGAEKVYEAAALWVDRALRRDDSLFTPGVPIWSSLWLGVLRERFLDRPDQGKGNFYDKLRTQLEGSPPEVFQLVGEVLYVQLLFVWRGTMRPGTKQDRINQVLGWSGRDITMPAHLASSLTPGIANFGPGRSTALPYYVGFLIEFAERWKELNGYEREHLLEDPWGFKYFTGHVDFRGALFRDRSNAYRPQREALLHLVHPDFFEGTVSIRQKEEFANSRAFEHFVTEETPDVDHKLFQIRRGLENDLGRDFDFYDPEIGARLDYGPLWSEFVKRAQEYVDTGRMEEEEINYKVETGRKLAEARKAVFGGGGDWADLVKKGISGNLIFSVSQAKFRDWINDSPEVASKALKALWAPDYSPVSRRIDAFASLLPNSATSGAGSRTTVTSVLLMGLDVESFPPFRTTIFSKAYEQTGYGQPEKDADEAGLYEHALGFLDRFIDEARERGLTLRHRLDAQSVIWGVLSGGGEEPPADEEQESETDWSPEPEPDLPALSEEVFLPVEFLEGIDKLLDEKKQVIFQGPPGTGKTFVAQKLARCLAGSRDRVTLVQFHPSYAYEDFVQGFRPVQTGDGQAGFELRDGPLLKAAERAKSEPDARHFLVIDEINRGNLAKVFGELYFLLEYRDEEISLQYQQGDDDKFSLPENLHIIGTMNTADRSIALVDLALRRRFYFVEFHPDDEPVRSVLYKWLAEKAPGMEWVADVVENANKELREDRHAAIGPSYFMKEALDRAAVERIWTHSVFPYVEECLFGERDRIGNFELRKLMNDGPHFDCIADGLSRFLGITREEAVQRLEAEGGVTQADISNHWSTWHAAFKTAGLKRITIAQSDKRTLEEIAEEETAFIARVRMHLVTVIDGQPFEACENKTDMQRKPNHYWIMDDNAGNAQVSVEQSGDA